MCGPQVSSCMNAYVNGSAHEAAVEACRQYLKCHNPILPAVSEHGIAYCAASAGLFAVPPAAAQALSSTWSETGAVQVVKQGIRVQRGVGDGCAGVMVLSVVV